jgi:ubiquinone/menaquinone biosynthesis C-methylase UbiE
MPVTDDRSYLLNEQYRDAANLNARALLHARFSVNPHGWLRWYFEQLHLPENARVLELGCGPCALWRENAERIPPGWQLVLSDFSPGMLDEARRNLSALARPVQLECVDAQAIPFGDASCDAVFANHMLYHVPDRDQALAEIRRVLKPDGCLYAATNGEQHLREITQLVQTALPDIDTAQVFVHVSEFTLENGAAQLARHFSDVSMLPYQDALRVTEAEPLLAYILSSPVKSFNLTQVNRLRDLLAKQIAEHGPIHISKAAGVFKARGTVRCLGEA